MNRDSINIRAFLYTKFSLNRLRKIYGSISAQKAAFAIQTIYLNPCVLNNEGAFSLFIQVRPKLCK